jgi:predicted ATP-grasp superfamily ATP-dependent carboligase
VALYRLDAALAAEIVAPSLVVAFDGWVDAGSAATVAVDHLATGGRTVATFENDQLYDYRSRRPTLDIVDGRLTEMGWPELTLRFRSIEERDVLVLTGPEPDDRWRTLADDLLDLGRRLGVVEWISLGAIPAAVPHTRSVPILGTEAQPGLLRGGVAPGPTGRLRVPAAAISALEMAFVAAGVPAVGYFAQVPHYVNGPYPLASVALLEAVARHLGIDAPIGALDEEARQIRTRLDAATSVDDVARTYVERLEGMSDEERLPSGDDLIADIEKYLRERGNEGSQRG